MSDPSKLAAIVLAAGFSSRMGHFKPLLHFGNETALERCVRGFKDSGIANVKVVVGHRAEDLIPIVERSGIDWVKNHRFEEGMFSSIKAGIKSLDSSTEAFFVQPVDTPLFRSSTISRLIETFEATGALVARPTFRGRNGHPPLISASLARPIIDWEAEGGLKSFLRSVESGIVSVETTDEFILLGMNTPEEYKELLERFTASARANEE